MKNKPINKISIKGETWYGQDTYKITIPVRRSLKAILKIIFKGELNLMWTVPSNKKDKRLILKGKLHANK